MNKNLTLRTTTQEVKLEGNNEEEFSKLLFGSWEQTDIHPSQPKKMSFREAIEKIRNESREAESKKEEYLKKRGKRLSILDYDD